MIHQTNLKVFIVKDESQVNPLIGNLNFIIIRKKQKLLFVFSSF